MTISHFLGFAILIASVVLLAVSFGPIVSGAYCVGQAALYVFGGRA